MKKYISLLAVCTLLLGCVGCQQSAVLQSKSPKEQLRITAVLPHEDFAYWTWVGESIMDAAGKLGVSAKVNIPQVNYNVKQMTELVREATAAKVDAIIVQGVDDEQFVEALRNASASGIQIVFVDTDLAEFPNHLYVGTDNYGAGVRMGQELIGRTGGTGEIAVLSGAKHYSNLEERLKGIEDAIDGYDLKLVCVRYDEYDSRIALEQINWILRNEPQVDSLLCIEGTGALTIGNLIMTRPEAFRCILAFDISEECAEGLRKGNIDAVMVQETREMGYRCVEEIVKYAEEGAYSSEKIHTGIRVVTAEDLEVEGYEN